MPPIASGRLSPVSQGSLNGGFDFSPAQVAVSMAEGHQASVSIQSRLLQIDAVCLFGQNAVSVHKRSVAIS